MYTLLWLEDVDSTNLYAKKNIKTLKDKTVVCANRQTSGRGRFNRKWIDLGEGNIFMTIVLKPSNNFSKVFPNITQYLSVVLCNTLEEYGINPSIKWPNDVLVDKKKIAGILSESVLQGSEIKGIALGIGINLNSDKNSLSKIEDKEATALNIELGREKINKDEFISKLLDKFFDNYDKFLKNGFSMIRDYYLDKACFLNEEISVQVFNDKKSGIAKTVNNNGELVLEKEKNELVLTMGDIL